MKSLGNISGFIKRMGLSRWQITFITAFLFIGIFHNFLANEDLIVCYEKSKIGILVPLSVCNSGLPAPIPYSANYIDKMSHYCKGCYYNKKEKTGERACPFNSFYWDFYDRNREKLERNPRIGMAYRLWNKMDSEKKEAILKQAHAYFEDIENL